jgi:hypothetical protein
LQVVFDQLTFLDPQVLRIGGYGISRLTIPIAGK